MVTFSHQKYDVLVTLSHQNSLHGAKTLPFSSKISRIKKVFGAKTSCFILPDLVPKREYLVDVNNKFKLIAKTIYSSVDNIQQHL